MERNVIGQEKQVRGYGSLRNDLARAMNISRGAADADDQNLRLFKQWAELSGQDKLRLTAALRATPRYEMVDVEESDGEDFGIEAPRPQGVELAALT